MGNGAMWPKAVVQQVAMLAERLAMGYYAQAAILEIAGSPNAGSLIPTSLADTLSAGLLQRKNGTQHGYNVKALLDMQRTNPDMVEAFRRAWPTGALLALADALDDRDYFDHGPLLEMVYHLRNGIAHGNKFNIANANRLAQFPAHTRNADFHGARAFEITTALNGQQVLFSFMDAGDIQDLLMSIGMYLRRLSS